MTDQSQTFSQQTLPGFGECISSQESQDGIWHSTSQDGETLQSGPAVVPASRSRPRVSKKAKQTSGTSGPISFGSSASASLQSSSENKSDPQSSSGELIVRSKTCSKCKTKKPYSEFYVNSKGNRRSRCMECTKVSSRVYKRQHEPQTRENFKEWRDVRRGYALTNVAKNRAKKRGMDFNLDGKDIQRRIDAGVCELTGIPFDLTQPRSWNAPSLDRIDCQRGYTQDNVRVVLYAVNVMANVWGPNRIVEISSAIIGQRKKASNDFSDRIGMALQQRLSQFGSMEYEQTWKKRITPSGRVLWEHTARARRISDSDFTGWPSPTASDTTGGKIPPGKANRSSPSMLKQACLMAGWPTPDANAMNDGESLESWQARAVILKEKHGNGNGAGMPLAIAAQLTGWSTPTVQDYSRGVAPPRPQDTGEPLSQQVAGWATTSARDWKDGRASEATMAMNSRPLNEQVVHGMTSTSSTAGTTKLGVLAPEFSRWLMAFPEAWDQASPGYVAWQKMQDAIASED